MNDGMSAFGLVVIGMGAGGCMTVAALFGWSRLMALGEMQSEKQGDEGTGA